MGLIIRCVSAQSLDNRHGLLAERFMRPIALGRKNYIFVGNETASHAVDRLYSLIETCQINGLNTLSDLNDELDSPNPPARLTWAKQHQRDIGW